jgi:hypothetical protein
MGLFKKKQTDQNKYADQDLFNQAGFDASTTFGEIEMAKKDLSTIIKHQEGKGAASYYYIKESTKEHSDARINAKELGQIKNTFASLVSKNTPFKIEEALLSHFCPWSEKTTLLNQLEAEGVAIEDAYNFMISQASGNKGPVKKTDPEKLASILVGLAPFLSPVQLVVKLEEMLKEHKAAAIKIAETMEKDNGRDDNQWIYTTSKEDRKKKADKK